MTSNTKTNNIVGEFIEIHAWKTFGMVIGQEEPTHGVDDAIRVLVQEHPDQRIDKCKWYQLEPGQYTMMDE